MKVFDCYYGTPAKSVRDLLKTGKNVLLCIDCWDVVGLLWISHLKSNLLDCEELQYLTFFALKGFRAVRFPVWVE